MYPSKYEPFPLKLLPKSLRDYVTQVADLIRVDPAVVATSLLTSVGTAIGRSSRILLHAAWAESSILWTIIVAESGTRKTPAVSLGLAPLEDLDEYAQEREEQVIVSDTTGEALDELLVANHCVLYYRDELAGILGSFDRYVSGRGGRDVAMFLELDRHRPIRVKRKGQAPLYAPAVHCCVLGTIQPGVLNALFGPQYRENGLLARFLLINPPVLPKAVPDTDLDPSIREAIFKRLERLWLNRTRTELKLSVAAREIWSADYLDHGKRMGSVKKSHLATWSKLERLTPRIALILHMYRWAGGTRERPALAVSEKTMRAARELADWYRLETLRVLRMLDGKASADLGRRVLKAVGSNEVSARDIGRGTNLSAQRVAAIAEKLVESGHLSRRKKGGQGRPTMLYSKPPPTRTRRFRRATK